MHGRLIGTIFALTAGGLLLAVSVTAAQGTATQSTAVSWLDRPLAGWNKAGGPVPTAPAGDEAKMSVLSRCRLTSRRSTSAEQAVDTAGWIAFWNFDQQLVREDVEIVGGMTGADGMCRPVAYHMFVFVGGRFAGVLSPTPMTSRSDSSSGAVRIRLPVITAEFARYAASDALCCPSSRVTVSYRVDRTAAGPVIIPVDVRTTRP